MELGKYIRNVQDFPKKGIGFKDITTLLKDKDAFTAAIDMLSAKFAEKKIDKVVGIESRGFIVGAPLAYKLGCGFVPVRKPGKLPAETLSYTYSLEYGEDQLEIHKDAIAEGENILVVDDLLATGGTLEATVTMIKQLGGNIQGIGVWIELTFLHGRDKLKDYDLVSLITYDSE